VAAKDPIWLTQDILRSVLLYDIETGVFTWRAYMNREAREGQAAGKWTASGYRYIRLQRKEVMAHRLAWLYVHGEWPPGEIDHINGARGDNRMCNLRAVTRCENMQNQHVPRPGSRSGLLGASWNMGRWVSSITRNGKRRQLGRFDTPEQAHAAYMAARSEVV
jgi:hypothetical protein